MIDFRTKKQIKRLFDIVVDDSLMDANFEYVESAIDFIRKECIKVEKYMEEIDEHAQTGFDE